jgi:hypothetical protein
LLKKATGVQTIGIALLALAVLLLLAHASGLINSLGNTGREQINPDEKIKNLQMTRVLNHLNDCYYSNHDKTSFALCGETKLELNVVIDYDDVNELAEKDDLPILVNTVSNSDCVKVAYIDDPLDKSGLIVVDCKSDIEKQDLSDAVRILALLLSCSQTKFEGDGEYFKYCGETGNLKNSISESYVRDLVGKSSIDSSDILDYCFRETKCLKAGYYSYAAKFVGLMITDCSFDLENRYGEIAAEYELNYRDLPIEKSYCDHRNI